MKEPTSDVSLPQYPQQQSHSEKYQTIILYMCQYTNLLMNISKNCDTCDVGVLDNDLCALRDLEAYLMDLSGDHGSHGYITETLVQLKSSLLDNAHDVILRLLCCVTIPRLTVPTDFTWSLTSLP